MKKLFLVALTMVALNPQNLFANEERERLAEQVDAAKDRLDRLSFLAQNKPGTPGEDYAVEAEMRNLREAQESFFKFVSHDCTNRAYHEGAVGGSALGMSIDECLLEKLNARITELSKRYEITID